MQVGALSHPDRLVIKMEKALLLAFMLICAWAVVGLIVGAVQSKQGVLAKDDAAILWMYSILWPFALFIGRERFIKLLK